MLFNEHDVLTVTEIETKTGIPKENLNPALLKLCVPQVQILSKEEKKAEFKPHEKIKVNLMF
jgi:hypothetical protein